MSPEDVLGRYIDAGFGVLFPLPEGQKLPPPAGVTGGRGSYPTTEQAERWLSDGRYGNFGLRMPPGVLGIDFDARKGGQVFDWVRPFLEAAPRSTSRGSSDPSGVYFVRVPDHLLPEIRDRHLAALGTEAIRPGHRYAVVWPSTHPDTGQVYSWYGPGGEKLEGPPELQQIPEIPESALRAGMESAAAVQQSKSRGLSGLGAAPKRKVELSELGSIKALMAGYHPYETTVSPGMRQARRAYEDKRVSAILEDLDALTSSSEPWEPTVGALALALYSFALAPWTSLSVEEAIELVGEHGPTCEKAQSLGVHGHAGACWSESNLLARAERSLGQHDGAWAQLPGNLRGSSLPDESPSEVDAWDDDFVGTPDGSGPPDDGDDDFFTENNEPDGEGELIWLTRDLPLEDPPEPLARNFCFRGMLSILSGAPGTGKSTIASLLCVGYKTLWCSSEEARGTIHARSLILQNDGVAVPPELVTLHDLPKIDRWLTENPDIELLVLDNLQSFASIKDDSYNDAVVKAALAPLLAILMKHGVACLGLSHPTKAKTSAVAGSGAWEQIARHVMLAHSVYLQEDGSFVTDRREDGHHVLVTVAKSNYPYRDTQLFRSSRQVVPVRTESGKQVHDWLVEPVGDDEARRAAEAALNGESGDGKRRGKTPAAELPAIENPRSLLDGTWVETDVLATQLGVPAGKILESLARYELSAVRIAEGRLTRVCLANDPVQEIDVQAGQFSVGDLMARLSVTRENHLMWLLAHLGLRAEILGDEVTVTNGEVDEIESALLDAGLGDI